MDLRIEAPGQAKRRAMLGAFDPIRVELLVHTSASKCSTDFIDLLNALEASYGGATRTRPLVAMMDNGPIHTSKLTTKALAERPWLTVDGFELCAELDRIGTFLARPRTPSPRQSRLRRRRRFRPPQSTVRSTAPIGSADLVRRASLLREAARRSSSLAGLLIWWGGAGRRSTKAEIDRLLTREPPSLSPMRYLVPRKPSPQGR